MPNSNFISTRTFGIEIEFIGNREQAVAAIQAAGIGCRHEEYNHRVSRDWKVTTDASVGYDNGELVSPILYGEAGLEQVRKVCAALRGIGHKVNKQCGVHVHVGVQDLCGPEVARVFKRYLVNEAKIDALMPRSRRQNANGYCRSLDNYRTGLMNANSVQDVRRAFYDERHVKLNVMAYVRQKTIEFRHHSGSLSGEKITNWIQFCVNFIENSRSLTAALPDGTHTPYRHIPVVPVRRRSNTARARAVAYIRRLHSFTPTGGFHLHDDVFARHLNVPIDSLASIVSSLRQDGFVIERRRREHAYFVTAIPGIMDAVVHNEQVLMAQNITFEAAAWENPFYGLPTEIVNYYEERAQDLANT